MVKKDWLANQHIQVRMFAVIMADCASEVKRIQQVSSVCGCCGRLFR